ncbi:MAG: DNA mismatch repair protein MutS [Chloroflexi bacterium]|nr:DNA mismatch repair protein MutS [Chloroflexota bacterium]
MTPIRRQYLEIKRRYPHAIVFFRLGDFYETFDDDAKLVARELEITLTSKPMGKGLRVPLAGVPYHAIDGHLSRLIAKGYKVAICEQMGDPATAEGLVDRQVVRVVTPGTVVGGDLLDERANNYLVALSPPQAGRPSRAEATDAIWEDDPNAVVGLAYADISTGEFVAGEITVDALAGELLRLQPAELLLPDDTPPPAGVETLVTHVEPDAYVVDVAEAALRTHFAVASSEAFGLAGQPAAVAAAGALLHYLRESQGAAGGGLPQITKLSSYRPDGFLALDAASRRNLELFAGGRQGKRQHSLLGVLDLTKTAMGARLLARRLGQPLLDLVSLEGRLDQVGYFFQSAVRRGQAQELLGGCPDIERLCGRAVAGLAFPRDLVGLRRGLEQAPLLRELLPPAGSPPPELLKGAKRAERDAAGAVIELAGRLRPCDDVVAAIAQTIDDEPGATLDQGGVVRPGFSEELDSLRTIATDTKRFLAELESKERERTGIRSLRIGYNRVFGYYIEVSKPNLSLVPDDYERRQTLVGGERYVTAQLKEYETRILTARERIAELEGEIFRRVCGQVAAAAGPILALAAAIAEVDVAVALAEVSATYGYVRPELDDGGEIEIRDGRHPVVERALAEATPTAGESKAFVPNDTQLSNGDAQIVVLTGPNMAGKSTYLRQVALIVLMAQVGSYVPAASARIGLVDRIFTRVGAQDDLASGQSTFLVEMLETANILHNATPRSLVVLDEIGRGTSTYDGMAIARAVVEYLHNKPETAAKTLFATHYHELVELAGVLPRVRNENVAVAEEEGRVVFLHKIVAGGADRSYGIHVAELAGLPKAVVQRAREVLATLEDGARSQVSVAVKAGATGASSSARQPSLLPARPQLLDDLAALEVDGMTPLEALTKLYELREQARSTD